MNWKLYGLYLFAGVALDILACSQRPDPRPFIFAVQVALSLIWGSFILAISLMEAWVKFQAPFLRKPVAVDVSRHVFEALHSVEASICLSLWVLHYVGNMNWESTLTFLSITSVLFSLQLAVLMPALVLRAKYVISYEMDTSSLTKAESRLHTAITSSIQRADIPHAIWHVVYVLFEFAKVGLLFSYAAQSLQAVMAASQNR